MRTRLVFLPLLVLTLAACGSPPSSSSSGTGGASSSSNGAGGASRVGRHGGRLVLVERHGGASSSSSGSGSGSGAGGGTDAGSGPDAALLRVHYPAGTHTVTVRGSAPRPELDDGPAHGGLGRHLHLRAPGLTAHRGVEAAARRHHLGARAELPRRARARRVDIWPHFTSTAGQVVTLIASFQSTVLGRTAPAPSTPTSPRATWRTPTRPIPSSTCTTGRTSGPRSPSSPSAGRGTSTPRSTPRRTTGACSSGGVVGWGAQPLGGTAVTCNGDGDCPSGRVPHLPRGHRHRRREHREPHLRVHPHHRPRRTPGRRRRRPLPPDARRRS